MRSVKKYAFLICFWALLINGHGFAESNSLPVAPAVNDIKDVNANELRVLQGASVNRNFFIIGTVMGFSMLAAGFYVARDKNTGPDENDLSDQSKTRG